MCISFFFSPSLLCLCLGLCVSSIHSCCLWYFLFRILLLTGSREHTTNSPIISWNGRCIIISSYFHFSFSLPLLIHRLTLAIALTLSRHSLLNIIFIYPRWCRCIFYICIHVVDGSLGINSRFGCWWIVSERVVFCFFSFVILLFFYWIWMLFYVTILF